MDILIGLNQLSLPAQFSDLAILIPRVFLGVVFFYHGWPKIKDLRANARDFEAMGFKPGWLWGISDRFSGDLWKLAGSGRDLPRGRPGSLHRSYDNGNSAEGDLYRQAVYGLVL